MKGLWQKTRETMRNGFLIPHLMRWEWFLVRLFTAVAIFLTIPGPTKPIPDSQAHPTGLAYLCDLSFYATPEFTGKGAEYLEKIGNLLGQNQPPSILQCLVLLLLALYVFGRFLPVTLILLTFIHITLFTLFNSQGDTNHNRQIVSMVLVAQCLVVLWPIFHRIFKREKLVLPPGRQLSHYMFFYSQQAIVGVYIISALTKLLRSKGLWMFQTPNLAFDLVKTHDQDYYTDLKVEKGAELEGVIAFFSDHPFLVILIMAPGLILELFAFAALYSRTAALVVGSMLIFMHELIDWLFKLKFGENEIMVLIYLVNVPFWIWVIGGKARRLRTQKSSQDEGGGVG